MTTINNTAVSRDDLIDIGVIAFSLLALAALLVSVPATFSVMAHFHTPDDTGWTQAVASLVVFEIGAISAKLTTLWIPQWRGRLHSLQAALLLFVVSANVYASAKAYSGWEIVGSVFFAALMPAFTAIFLALAAARAEARRDARLDVRQTPEQRIVQALQKAQERQLELALEAFERASLNAIEGITVSNAASQEAARIALDTERNAVRTEQKAKLRALLDQNPNASKADLARGVGVSKTEVYRLLEELGVTTTA